MAVFVGTPEWRRGIVDSLISTPPLSETEVLKAEAQPTKILAAKRFPLAR
jgi:hypothetical protein